MEMGIVAKQSDRKMYIVAEYSVNKNVPTFFIDRNLMQATAISDLPDEFRRASSVPYLIYRRISAENPQSDFSPFNRRLNFQADSRSLF